MTKAMPGDKPLPDFIKKKGAVKRDSSWTCVNPDCGDQNIRTIDSYMRHLSGCQVMRRYRICATCGWRFVTDECIVKRNKR